MPGKHNEQLKCAVITGDFIASSKLAPKDWLSLFYRATIRAKTAIPNLDTRMAVAVQEDTLFGGPYSGDAIRNALIPATARKRQ